MHDRNCTGARRRAFTTAAMALAAAALGLTGTTVSAQNAQNPQNAQSNPEVRVTTNMGSFVIELRPHRAPRTVADFLRYVRTGFYTDTLIHRVVANFIIQGGGHEATPPYALKPTGPPVVNESGNGLENRRGTVGLARGPKPDSGTAQFYINLVDNPELDPLPTRWGYAVFGKVIQGMNVVEHIGLVPTGTFGPFKSEAPLKPVIIKSIKLVSPSQSSNSSASATPSSSTGSAPAAGNATQSHSTSTPAVQPNATGTSSGGHGQTPNGSAHTDQGPTSKSAGSSTSGNGSSGSTSGNGSSGAQTKPPAAPAGVTQNPS